MQRRTLLHGGAAWPLTQALPAAAQRAPGVPKVLRVAVAAAEAGFDPPRVSDQTSQLVTQAIFEAPLRYDYLARPSRLRPATAVALPEVSDNHRRFVVTLQRGILFADDPAFKGRPRELVAADYVYSLKRFYDPAIITEHLYTYENAKLLDLSELRRQVLASKTPFPYDLEVPGIRALDRYRFEVRLAEPNPRFTQVFAGLSAVAREVIETYAADPMAHPVGTGPFRLAQWRRSSLIVLERNPRFRGEVFDSRAEPGDAAGLAAEQHLQGKRLPLLDRVEISVITEDQPRWLAFVGGALDAVRVPEVFAPRAVPGGQLAPYLARQGVQLQSHLASGVTFSVFNCEDPVVGGLTPDRVALRRAIALACDNAALLRHAYQGQGVVAQSMIPPHNVGYDRARVSELGRAEPARAKALLDMHGYVDRNGDGLREQPDGQPLRIELASREGGRARAGAEIWRKRMLELGLDFSFSFMPFPELIRRTLAGRLQMVDMSWNAGPDGEFFLGLAYGPNAGQSNDARFRLPAYDTLFERQRALSDGPERLAAMDETLRTMLAYMPYIPHVHPRLNDLAWPHLRGWVSEPLGDSRFLHTDIVA